MLKDGFIQVMIVILILLLGLIIFTPSPNYSVEHTQVVCKDHDGNVNFRQQHLDPAAIWSDHTINYMEKGIKHKYFILPGSDYYEENM